MMQFRICSQIASDALYDLETDWQCAVATFRLYKNVEWISGSSAHDAPFRFA